MGCARNCMPAQPWRLPTPPHAQGGSQFSGEKAKEWRKNERNRSGNNEDTAEFQRNSSTIDEMTNKVKQQSNTFMSKDGVSVIHAQLPAANES